MVGLVKRSKEKLIVLKLRGKIVIVYIVNKDIGVKLK